MMTLAELLDLLTQFLIKSQEYLSTVHGRKSFVRYVGSRLPIKAVRRIRFEYVKEVSRNKYSPPSDEWDSESCDYGSDETFVFTLADIPWLEVSSPEKSWRHRCEMRVQRKPRRKTMYVKPFITKETTRRDSSMLSLDDSFGSVSSEQYTDPEAMLKISALEDELAKLRLQIASIVSQTTVPENFDPTFILLFHLGPLEGLEQCIVIQSVFFLMLCLPASISTPILPALCTSTPVCSPAPPPPPPPPPPPMQAKKMKTVSEIIAENKSKSGRGGSSGSTHAKPGGIDMSEVLKGLGTVKLRKIARSPGGTPVRQVPKSIDNSDPATIIARALKKKFAHTQSGSPDKENISRFTPSPKKGRSPMKPSPLKIGPHLLKPSKKKKRLSTPTKGPLMEVNA
ncbi:Mitochondrial fission regulator 2 [Holothuria leucospilota]|uniref:Mitochondrial fission regulator 2 n=1 Tax=Holothuria leucospilota TaxID=206669 RepID=A0A9Q1BUC7_HOLLE|nr:Mitochondrial fission regulator 2 [Holothuria leucospilota]